MNKSVIIILAVCLLSAQAFVKRDAPVPPKPESTLEVVQQKLKEISDQIKNTVNPDSVKAALDKIHEQTKHMIDAVMKNDKTPQKE